MKLTLKKTFLKDLQKVQEPHKREVKTFLERISHDLHLLETIPHTRKIRGKSPRNFYRIRFGDYRLGYEKREDEIIIYRILHRKDIYRYFP